MAEAVTLERPTQLNDAEIDRLAAEFEERSAQALLEWALPRFGERIAIATSFQAEGLVVLDMARRLAPDLRVITVDSGRLRQETYDLIDRVRERYGGRIEVVSPDAAELDAFVSEHGPNPFYRSVDLRVRCCQIRKVSPLTRALTGLDAWIAGQRRGQAATRRAIRTVERDDARGGIVKLNPLANWTDEQVWAYLRANDVPHNALYDQGYTSIGCAPCTRPTKPGEDPRSGRWWWETNVAKECGLHCRVDWNSLRA